MQTEDSVITFSGLHPQWFIVPTPFDPQLKQRHSQDKRHIFSGLFPQLDVFFALTLIAEGFKPTQTNRTQSRKFFWALTSSVFLLLPFVVESFQPTQTNTTQS